MMLVWMGYLKQSPNGDFDKATADAFTAAMASLSSRTKPPQKFDGKTITPQLYAYLRTEVGGPAFMNLAY